MTPSEAAAYSVELVKQEPLLKPLSVSHITRLCREGQIYAAKIPRVGGYTYDVAEEDITYYLRNRPRTGREPRLSYNGLSLSRLARLLGISLRSAKIWKKEGRFDDLQGYLKEEDFQAKLVQLRASKRKRTKRVLARKGPDGKFSLWMDGMKQADGLAQYEVPEERRRILLRNGGVRA